MMILVFALAGEDRILSGLRKRFPSVGFKKCHVNHDLESEGRGIIIIDTFRGVDKVRLVENLESEWLGKAMEGSDIIITLRVLKKLGAIDTARVIAVPEGHAPAKSLEEICSVISSLLTG